MEAVLSGLPLDLESLDRSSVSLILGKLTEQLTQAQEELELLQRKHAPVIGEFHSRNAKLKQTLSQVQKETISLDYASVIVQLERRKNDAQTEEAYLDKILNRQIEQEFVTILKSELKNLLQSIDPNSNLEQVPASHSGCSSLQKASLFVSSGVEKMTSTIHLCCSEVATKVFPGQVDAYAAFAEFCLSLLQSLSRKLVTKKAQQLPQFMALLANDLAYLLAFIHERFAGIKGAQTALTAIRALRQQILLDFVNVHKREISEFFASGSNDLDRIVKRVSLHLSRLANVLRPVLLPADCVNLLTVLLQETQKQTWQLFSVEYADIGSDEIQPLEQFCRQILDLPGKLIVDVSVLEAVQAALPLTRKLRGFFKLLPLSLVQIINAFHRDEFDLLLSNDEISRFINSIFADSSLKSEFLRELSLS